MNESRGRQGRQEEVATERRRRSDATLDGGQAKKLAIPAAVQAQLQAEGRTPRWINDEGNRLHNLTVLDDYDRVDGVEPVPVGTSKDGKPILSYLHAKRSDFLAEDAKKKDAGRRLQEEAMLKGRVPGADPLPREVSYADRANKIERGHQPI